MKWLSGGLTFVNFATACGLLIGMLAGGLSAAVAWAALILAAGFALLAYLRTTDSEPQFDASLLKTTRIGERMRIQLGFEAFNLLNHNYFGRDNVNTTPDEANGRFGSIFPGQVSTQNILPRQIQVRFKFNW